MLNEACSGCDPKIDVLKESAEIFMQLWKGLAVTDDRIGLVYFRTTVEEEETGGDVLVSVLEQTDNLIEAMNDEITESNQYTAMGGGLQVAINTLDEEDRPRDIILFTDGMQNVDPGCGFPRPNHRGRGLYPKFKRQ